MRGLRLALPKDRKFVCRWLGGRLLTRLRHRKWFNERLKRPGFYVCDFNYEPAGAAWVEGNAVYWVDGGKFPDADIKNWMVERVQSLYGGELTEKNACER